MADLMTFPNTVEEFMEQYKIVDTEQVYTNGAELVPIFRMKQWFEHLPTADVRENVHARWKIYNICDYANRPTGRRVGECSNCGQLTPEWRKLLEEPLWYFCPKCGAVMDEVE